MQYTEAEWDIGYSRAYIGISSWEYLKTGKGECFQEISGTKSLKD